MKKLVWPHPMKFILGWFLAPFVWVAAYYVIPIDPLLGGAQPFFYIGGLIWLALIVGIFMIFSNLMKIQPTAISFMLISLLSTVLLAFLFNYMVPQDSLSNAPTLIDALSWALLFGLTALIYALVSGLPWHVKNST